MQTITVDMTPGFRQPTIHYSQNDVGTTFAIDLRSRFGDTLPASPTVKIQATKPSGFGFSIEADSVVDSVATFTTVATMTDEAGRFLAELEVSDSGVVLYTANFYMEGEANPHPIGTTDGSQETIIPTLTLLVERVEAAAASVLDMTVNATTLAAGSQATYSYDEDTNTATFGIPQGEAGAGSAGVVANAYSASSTYVVGDYVIHNSNLYRCTTAITTAEAWTSGHWTQVALAPEVSDLKSAISDISKIVYSENLNDEIYEGGYFNSAGEESGTSATSFRTKNYLPVQGGSTICWWGYLSDGTTLGANAIIVEYDASKNVLNGGRESLNKYGSSTPTAITLNANTKYVRFGLYQAVADHSTIKLSIYYSADAKTMYTPYSAVRTVEFEKIADSQGKAFDDILIDRYGITPLYQYTDITVEAKAGALGTNGTVIETTDVYRYEIPVLKGEKYIICAKHGYATYKAYLLTDTQKNVLSYYPTTTSGSVLHRNVEVEVTEDGYLVLQKVYGYEPFLGKVSKYISNDNLYRKKVYWNGDSICYGAGGTSFANQISFFHAMEETMDAASGTRLSTRSGHTNSIYERVIAMDTSADYDYIGIEGGYNDYFSLVTIGSLTSNYTSSPDTSTVIGAVEGICKHIRTYFPNSKFFFVLGHRPINVGQYATVVDTYWDAIISALEKWAVPYVDLRKEGTLMAYNNDWLSDYFGEGETQGTHPNTLGYRLFYNNLVESKMQTL